MASSRLESDRPSLARIASKRLGDHRGLALSALVCIGSTAMVIRARADRREAGAKLAGGEGPLPAAAEANASPLTSREADVMACLATGRSLGEASEALGIAKSTVRVHIHNICRKLEVETIGEAIAAHGALGQQNGRPC